MRPSGILQTLSIRIVSSEARCGSCEGCTLLCRCMCSQKCHADELPLVYRRCTREHTTANQFNKVSLRPVFWITVTSPRGYSRDPGSSAHEVAPPSGSGWVRKGERLAIGNGKSRAICAMVRAWRLLAGGLLKRDAVHRVKHSEQLPTQC